MYISCYYPYFDIYFMYKLTREKNVFYLLIRSPPAVQYVSQHSKGQIAVVENEEQLKKFLAIKSKLPDLKGKMPKYKLLSNALANCILLHAKFDVMLPYSYFSYCSVYWQAPSSGCSFLVRPN